MASFNGTLNALCPNCSIFKELEACRHCYQPLCVECRLAHILTWKTGASKYCDNLTKKCEKYLTRINSLSPLINQNETNITKVKMEIEEVFEKFVENLNEQKNELFLKLDEIKKENEQFRNFENDIHILKTNLTEFQEIVKINDIDKILIQFNKFQECRDSVTKISVNYSGLKKKPFKIVGEYEKPEKLNFEKNFFGNLIINESDNILKSPTNAKDQISSKQKSKKENQNLVSFDANTNNNQDDDKISKVHMFGTLRVRLKRLVEQIQEVQLIKTPIIEIDVKIMPKFIASFNNLVYFCDEEANLAIAEFRSLQNLDSLTVKSIQKLTISGIRGLAVNKKYLAISFMETNLNPNKNSLDSKQKGGSKSETTKVLCGVALFKINDSIIQFDKVIDNQKDSSFLSPNGIMLNDNFLFVCDRELHGIYKFEAKTGNLVQKAVFNNEQEPSNLALLLDSNKHFIFSDSNSLVLNLVESTQFNFALIIKSVKLADDYNLSFNEPLDIVTSQINVKDSSDENHSKESSSLVFVKHRAESKVMVYDTNLNLKYSFEYENSNGQGINYLRLNGKNDLLLMGYFNNLDSDSKTRFKLGIFNDF